MLKILLLIGILRASHCSCPEGFELAQDGLCKRFYDTITTVHAEQATQLVISKCKEIGADPIIIHSAEQQNDWSKRWEAADHGVPVIGLVCNSNTQQWEWSDGSAVDFKPNSSFNSPDLNKKCNPSCAWYFYYDCAWRDYCDSKKHNMPVALTPYTIDVFCQVAPTPVPEAYCKCGIVNDWFDDWKPSDIWLDIVIILDTSKPMSSSLEEAKSAITSFVSLMSTDPSAEFYSRIGVIAMSDKPEVIYNLNMTFSDDLENVKPHQINKIDVGAAFQAALKMFADGRKASSYRDNAQQVIYFLTNSAPGVNMNVVDGFKAGGGIVIVNDFVIEGTVADPGLQKFASDDFFFTDLSEDYLRSLGVLCEANCFCSPDSHPFNDDKKSPRTRANRGCFHPVNNGIPQQKARETCQKENASLVSIHDSDKEIFVNSVVSVFGEKKKFWIGLQNDGSKWNWDDKSTDPFTDWDSNNGQPNTNFGTAQCAYAQQGTGPNAPWTAANCAAGSIVYLCESTPCSIGYKNCA